MFDYHVLDMIELGVEKFVSLKDIKVRNCCKEFSISATPTGGFFLLQFFSAIFLKSVKLFKRSVSCSV